MGEEQERLPRPGARAGGRPGCPSAARGPEDLHVGGGESRGPQPRWPWPRRRPCCLPTESVVLMLTSSWKISRTRRPSGGSASGAERPRAGTKRARAQRAKPRRRSGRRGANPRQAKTRARSIGSGFYIRPPISAEARPLEWAPVLESPFRILARLPPPVRLLVTGTLINKVGTFIVPYLTLVLLREFHLTRDGGRAGALRLRRRLHRLHPGREAPSPTAWAGGAPSC